MFRKHKAIQIRKAKEVYFGRIRRIQKFYRKRHIRKIKCINTIRSYVKMYFARKKYRKFRKIARASEKLKHTIHQRDQGYGFLRVKLETSAIAIQT